ncbi:MAG: hypothetical protein JSU91_06610 [Thermoplasmatales archaeon]|nr:MAG: hypothetical protein JSU91_06610 [Thermoplasmatales archaeon]
MKGNPVLYKTLVVGVIVLFIGIGVQPAFAVTKDISDSDDDCDICPKVSKSHLLLIKSFLKRLEKYDDESSVLSKLNPEIEEKYQEISYAFSSLSNINKESDFDEWNFPVICNILWIIGGCLKIGLYTQGVFISLILSAIGFFAIYIGFGLDCWSWWWY